MDCRFLRFEKKEDFYDENRQMWKKASFKPRLEGDFHPQADYVNNIPL